MNTKQSSPCFYLPKQLMTKKYSDFSAESKLLFAMIFTNCEHSKSIKETSDLIQNISEKDLEIMRSQFQKDKKEGKLSYV